MATSKRSLTQCVLLFVVVFLFFTVKNVCAVEECYIETYFPHATKLTETDNGIKVELSGIYAENCGGPTAKILVPIIIWQKNNGWKYLEKKNGWCAVLHEDNCSIKIPTWRKILPEEFCKGSKHYKFCLENADNGEGASSCAIINDSVWFGINFYQGEGSYGYGGLGRYDRKTNIVDVRRIPELKDYPIHKVAWDGKNIWAATTNNYECTGHPPALGLVKYDWGKNKLTIFKGTETGPCGFMVNDLLWSQGYLWVATDVGISRWDSGQDKWTHYLPSIKPPYTVTISEGSCDMFYKSILDSFPEKRVYASSSPGAPEWPYSFFYLYLKKFRPYFIKQYENNK